MRTIKIKVYQFKELNEKAKEKAMQWWREASAGDSFAWDNTQEDAKNIGLKLLGEDRGNMAGEFIIGASDCIERIIKGHGGTCETFQTARKYETQFAELVKSDEEFDSKWDEIEDEFLKSICEDYRIMLQKEYEYQDSEEYITETIEANEYEFDETGKRVNY